MSAIHLSTVIAVLFSFGDGKTILFWTYGRFATNFRWFDIPTMRDPRQVYVLWDHESPPRRQGRWAKLDEKRFYFNWTMTYRLNSDVPLLYGQTIQSNTSYKMNQEFKDFLVSRPNILAWASSDCSEKDATSNRLEYVRELSKYIHIDTYGSCGNLTCPKENNNDCLDMMGQMYKFYLALENSACKDYITEKFYEKVARFMVPIVFKREIYNGMVPPNSFVAVDDFANPQELANFLLNMDSKHYLEFFAWREQGYVTCQLFHYLYAPIPDEYPANKAISLRNCNNSYNGYCQLCKMLYLKTDFQSYGSMKQWWDKDGFCDDQKDLNKLKL